MRDVARMAHVSQSTVSRVLNGAAEGFPAGIPIGHETRQRVLDAVQALGYVPNLYAGSLRGQKTFMIAMMVADVANPFYHPMVRAVQDVAYGHRYDVMIANTDHTCEDERLFIESVIRRPVDGIVMAPFHLTEADIERLLARTGVAVSALGQHVKHPQVDTVFGDDEAAVFDALTWLIRERGHQRIGFIGVSSSFAAGARRMAAYRQAMHSANLKVLPELIALGDWSADSGERAMRILLTQAHPPTAVFSVNDLMAIGAMEAALQAGMGIPDDVAIMGFDDIPPATWVHPRLTTVAQHPAEMGRVMAAALFERILGRYSGQGRRFEVPCRLVVRESA